MNKPHNCRQGNQLLKSRIEGIKNKTPQVGQTICDGYIGGRIEEIDDGYAIYGEFRTRISNLVVLNTDWGGDTWGVIDPVKIDYGKIQQEPRQEELDELLLLAGRRLTKSTLGLN